MLTKQAKKTRLVEKLRHALYGPAPKDHRVTGTALGVTLGDLAGKISASDLATKGLRPTQNEYLGTVLGSQLVGGLGGYRLGKAMTLAERQAYRRRVVKRTAAGLLGAGGGGAYLATRNKKK